MARSTKDTDSGCYVNGVYTSKNGSSASGLNCPKGVRLYDPTMKDAVFFMPDDRGETEMFEMITPEVAPGILPYYAISNYGRVMNVKTGKIMKPNYRPNGYEYLCLASDDGKNGQKKYTTHRMVMMTFDPIDNMENLEIDHRNKVKADNYINKTMPDGSIQSNLEWVTSKENAYRRDNGYDPKRKNELKLSKEDAAEIRELRDQGYSYKQINTMYPSVSLPSIQNVCKNKTYIDESYTPRSMSKDITPRAPHRITANDVTTIRNLVECGIDGSTIQEKFYPEFSKATIYDIIKGKTHNEQT